MRPGARGGFKGRQQARCEACRAALKWRFTGGVFWEQYCPACEAKAEAAAKEAQADDDK